MHNVWTFHRPLFLPLATWPESARFVQTATENHGNAVLVILGEPLLHGLHLSFCTRIPGTVVINTGIATGSRLELEAALHDAESIFDDNLY